MVVIVKKQLSVLATLIALGTDKLNAFIVNGFARLAVGSVLLLLMLLLLLLLLIVLLLLLRLLLLLLIIAPERKPSVSRAGVSKHLGRGVVFRSLVL